MGGANYMGGRRNAMKARAKDQVGQKQKGFFKRQRLDMLAKGLSGSLEPMKSHHLETKVGPGDIELGHAKQKTLPEESSGANGFIPSPIHVSSIRSRSGKRRRIGEAHTSSSDVEFKSEILDKLDQCEPLFLRKVMDQILATPDLASLSHKSPVASSCQDQTHKRRRIVTQTQHPVARPMFESTIGIVGAKETSPKKSSTSGRLRVNAIEESSVDDISDWDTPCDYDGSTHDSGYGDNFGDSIASDSDWSVYRHNSVSSATRHEDDGNGCEKALPSSSEYETGGATGSITGFSAFEEQNLQVKPAKKSVFIRDDGETIYGRLFEDPDPWRRIGIILGLEKDVEQLHAPGDDEDIQFDNNDKTPNLECETRKNDDSINENTFVDTERDVCSDEVMSPELEPLGASSFLEGFNNDFSESDTQNEDSQEVLAMPQLLEVNGKFLAPSISVEWESEEE